MSRMIVTALASIRPGQSRPRGFKRQPRNKEQDAGENPRLDLGHCCMGNAVPATRGTTTKMK